MISKIGDVKGVSLAFMMILIVITLSAVALANFPTITTDKTIYEIGESVKINVDADEFVLEIHFEDKKYKFFGSSNQDILFHPQFSGVYLITIKDTASVARFEVVEPELQIDENAETQDYKIIKTSYVNESSSEKNDFKSISEISMQKEDGGGDLHIQSGSPASWWNESYNNRKQLNISNTDGTAILKEKFTINFTLDTQTLISDSKLRSDCEDLRVLWLNSTTWQELDRITTNCNSTNTKVEFRNQENISASGFDDNYFIYYANPSATSGPNNKSNVYYLWEDFEDQSHPFTEGTLNPIVGSNYSKNGVYGLFGNGGGGYKRAVMPENLSRGFKIESWVYSHGDGSNADLPGICTGMQSTERNGYQTVLDWRSLSGGSSDMQIRENYDSGSPLATNTTNTVLKYFWYYIEMDWYSDGTINSTIYDENMTFFGSLRASDSTYTIGYFGVNAYKSGQWDDVKVTLNKLSRPIVTKLDEEISDELEIQLISPSNEYVFDTLNVNVICGATTPNELTNITLFTNTTGTWVSNQTVLLSGNHSNVTFNLTLVDTMSYLWNCEAYDNTSTTKIGETNRSFNVTLGFDYAPQILLLNPPDNFVNNNHTLVNLTFKTNATDDNSLVNCSLYTNLTGSWNINDTIIVSGTENILDFNLTNINTAKHILWNIGCYDNINKFGVGTTNRTVILDNVEPAIIIQSPLPQNYSTENITINISSNEPLNYCNYTLDNWLTEKTTSLINTTFFTKDEENLSDGTYTLKVKCDDSYNNTNSTQEILFTINYLVPSINLTVPPDNYLNNLNEFVNITFSANINDGNGLINCSLYHNYSGTWGINQTNVVTGTVNTTNFMLSNLTNSTFDWNIQCFDEGNYNSFATNNYSITLDTYPPYVTVNAPSGSYADPSPQINATIIDSANWVWYELLGANTTLCQDCEGEQITTSNLPEGSYTINVYANDTQGNTNNDSSNFNITFSNEYFELYDENSSIIIANGSVVENGLLGYSGTGGEILVNENFNDGNYSDGSPETWYFVNEGVGDNTPEWLITSGVFTESGNCHEDSSDNGRDTTAKACYAYPDNRFWTDMNMTVDLRASDDDQMGLMFRYQDKDNYYRVRFAGTRNFRKLDKFVGGVWTELDADNLTDGGLTQNNWHNVSVVVIGNQIDIYLNGVKVLNATDSSLTNGSIALYSWGMDAGSYGGDFDNLKIISLAQGYSNTTTYLEYINTSNPKTSITNLTWTENNTNSNNNLSIEITTDDANWCTASNGFGISTESCSNFTLSNMLRYRVKFNSNGSNQIGIQDINITWTEDTSSPDVLIIKPSINEILLGLNTLNISANDSESGVDYIEYIVRYLNNSVAKTWENLTLTQGDANNGYWTSELNTTTLPDDEYIIEINATDVAMLSNDSENIHIKTDNIIPQIQISSPNFNETRSIESDINITVNVLDNINIKLVNATIFYPAPNTTISYINLTNTLGDEYRKEFSIPLLEGQYNITINAISENNITSQNNTQIQAKDIANPEVIISNPSSGESIEAGTVMEINVSIFDQTNLSANFTITKPDNATESYVLEKINSTFYQYNFTNATQFGNYTIYVNASDGNTNINDTESSWFSAVDLTPPSEFNLTSPLNTTINTTTNPIMHWEETTEINFKNYTLIVYEDELRTQIHSVYQSNIKSNTTIELTTSLDSDKTYYWEVIAFDNFENNRTSNQFFEYTTDVNGPLISFKQPDYNESKQIDTEINISVNITDNLNITNTEVIIFYPNQTSKTETFSVNGINYNTTFQIPLLLGQYNISVNATSKSNKTSQNITQFQVVDLMIPALTIDSPIDNSSFTASSTVEINVSVSDQTNVSVSVTVEKPNSAKEQYQMYQINSSFYQYNFTNTSQLGSYNISINATDESGNYNDTQYVEIQAIETTPPTDFNLTSPGNNTVSSDMTPSLIWEQTSEPNFANYTVIIYETNNKSVVNETYSVISITNTTIDLPNNLSSDFEYYWDVRAFDIYGNSRLSNQLYKYTTDNTIPIINITSPNDTIVRTNTTTFNYVPTDLSLVNCSLFINTSGSWESNQTNISAVSGQTNNFSLNLGEGNYLWNVRCDDGVGNYAFSNSNATFSVAFDNPSLELVNPPDKSGDSDGSFEVYYNITHIDAIANCTLELEGSDYVDDSINLNQTNNFSLVGFSEGTYDYNITCTDVSGYSNQTETRSITVILLTQFGANTTLIDGINIENISNFTVEKENLGKIIFTEGINFTGGLNANQVIQINEKLVSVDVETQPKLNTSATIEFYNLSYQFIPILLRNNNVCTDCSTIDYSFGKLSVQVPHFTNYSLTNNSQLEIWDDGDVEGGNNTKYEMQYAHFYANYSNTTSSLSIAGSSYCEISINGTTMNMTYNATSNYYEYTKLMEENDEYAWSVSCVGQSQGYENISLSDSLSVTYPDNWWDVSYSACKNIEIKNIGYTQISDVPAYVELSNESEMQSDYDDLRFVDQPCGLGGELINYEIELKNTTQIGVWIEPINISTPGTIISVYYGNSGVTNMENSSAVWNASKYGLVYHMQYDGNDTTDNGVDIDSVVGSPTENNSIISYGIDTSTNNAWNMTDVAYWEAEWYNRSHEIVFTTSSDVTTRQALFAEGGGTNGIMMYIIDGRIFARWWSETTPILAWFGDDINATIEENTTYHAIMTYEYPGNYSFYLNGQLIDTNKSVDLIDVHTGNGGIGYTGDDTKDYHDGNIGPNYFSGTIHEFRTLNLDPGPEYATQTSYSLVNYSTAITTYDEIKTGPEIVTTIVNATEIEALDTVLINSTVVSVLGNHKIAAVNATVQYPNFTEVNISLSQWIANFTVETGDIEGGVQQLITPFSQPSNAQAETGTINLTGLTNTVTLTNTYNISKAFIVRRNAMLTSDTNQEPDGGTASIEWTGCAGEMCNQLNATRYASDAEDAMVSYSILQADNIQTWNFTINWAGGDTTKYITPTTNLPSNFNESCFVNIHRSTRINSNNVNDYAEAEIKSNITAVDNVTLERYAEALASPAAGVTFGEIVCFNDGTQVQQVFYGMGESEPHTDNIPISEVNLSKAWEVHNHRHADDGVGQNSLLGNLTSPTNLEMYYAETGSTSYQPELVAYIMNHPENQNITINNYAINPGSSDQDITNTITEVNDLNRTLLVCYNSMAAGGGTAHTRDYWAHEFTDNSTIRSINYRTRGGTQTTLINCQVVEWPEYLNAEEEAEIEPIYYYDVDGNTTDLILNITVDVDISVFDISASTELFNNAPDVRIEFAMDDDNSYVEVGELDIGEAGVFSVTITNETVLEAWKTIDNRDMRLVGFNIDSTLANQDEINITGVNVTINHVTQYPYWTYIWNDTNLTGLYEIINVFAIDKNNFTASTDYSNINFTVVKTVPSPFNLYSPVNGTISTDRQPILIWNETTVPKFQNYTIQIDDNSDFSSPEQVLIIYALNETTNQTALLSADQTYYWRVIAYNMFNNATYSNQNFTYITDNTLPEINLTYPASLQIVQNNTIEFNYSVLDTNLENCTLYTNATGSWLENETNVTPINGFNYFTNNLADGNYLWNVECFDGANQKNTALNNFSFIIDTKAPIVNAYIPVNNTEENETNNIYFEYNVSDELTNISQCQIIVDGEVEDTDFLVEENIAQNFTVYVGNGVHTWGINCTDNNGLIGHSGTYDLLVAVVFEFDPPVVILNSPMDNKFFQTNNVSYNFTPTDATGIENCSILFNGTINQTNSAILNGQPNYFDIDNQPDEDYEWYVECYDNNTYIKGDSEIRYYTIDTVNPVVTLNKPDNDTFYNESNVFFNFTPTDTNLANCSLFANFSGTFQSVQTNSSPLSGQSNSINQTVQDGLYIWNIQCYDYSGRKTFATHNYTVKVDANNPVFESVTAYPISPLNYSENIFHQFNITLNESFTDSVLIEHNFTGTLTNYSSSTSQDMTYIYNIGNISPGNYTYKWFINDSLGRDNETSYYTYYIGKGIPDLNLTLNGVSDNISVSLGGDVTIVSLLNEPTNENFTVYQDGVLINSTISPLNITNVTTYNSPGTFVILANVTENENYTSANVSYTITIEDIDDPIISLIIPANNTTVGNEDVNFQYNVTDASNITECRLYVDNILRATNSSVERDTTQVFEVTLADGDYYYYIRCSDTYSNIGYSSTYNFSVFDSTLLNLTTSTDKTIYQEGELINFTHETTDAFGNPISSSYVQSHLVNTKTSVPWWHKNWTVRKQIILNETNNNDQNLVVANITINTQQLITDGKLNSDCSDMRFADGITKLDYALVSGCNTTTTIFQINTNLTGTENTIIYAYYNNSGASDESTALWTAIGETGSIDIDSFDGTIANFSINYSAQPIIFATPVTQNAPSSTDDSYNIPTIFSVGNGGMNISLCQDNALATCSNPTATETVHYFVFDEDKTNKYSWIDIGRINVTTAGGTTTANFGKTLSEIPFVFTTAQTYNQGGNISSITWAGQNTSMTTSSAPLIGCVHQAPGSGTSENVCESGQPNEEVAYMALDVINANISTLQTGTEDIQDSTWTPATFSLTYSSPRVMVTQNADNGTQDPQYPWAKSVTGSGMNFRFCEQDGADDCDSHNAESTMWFALEDGVILAPGISHDSVSSIEGVEETLILTLINNTDIAGYFIYEWDSLNQSRINYSILTYANKSGFSDSYDFAQFELLPDSTPPNITLFKPDDNYTSSNTTVILNWTSFDYQRNQTCNITVDGIINQSNIYVQNFEEITLQLNNTSEGMHLWNVTCNDSYNNINTSQTRTFVIDITPPSIQLSSPDFGYNTSNQSIEINFTATDTNSENISCSIYIDNLNKTSNFTVANSILNSTIIDNVSIGNHTWNVSCTDEYSNSNWSDTWEFFIFGNPGLIRITWLSNQSSFINWSAVDGAESYSIYMTDNLTEGFSATPNVTGLTQLNYTDSTANQTVRRFYRISAIRDTVETFAEVDLGKYETDLFTGFNLISIPFLLYEYTLKNATNNGYIFETNKTNSNCITSLWRYSESEGHKRTDWLAGEFIPATGSEDFIELNETKAYWLELNESCRLFTVGEVLDFNLSINLDDGLTATSWTSGEDKKLPTDYEPIIFHTNPPYSIEAINRFNSTNQTFEVTIHYLVGGTPWGWYPSFDNQNFLRTYPMEGYFFSSNASIWEHEP